MKRTQTSSGNRRRACKWLLPAAMAAGMALTGLFTARPALAAEGEGKAEAGAGDAAAAMHKKAAAMGMAGMMGPVEVSVLTIKPEHVLITTELPGRTSAFLVAEVRPQANGLIQKRLFTEGSDVKEGQILYQIDPSSCQAEVENAAASLAVNQKAYDRAQANLSAAMANVTQQEATLELAKINQGRAERLSKAGAMSISDRDKAVTETKVDEATLKSAEEQVRSDREAVAEAKASIQQAQAALKSAQINLDHCGVLAPIGGRIGKSSVTVGALASAYQSQAFTTIQQMDPIYVDVPRSTTELARMKRSLEKGELKQNGELARKVQIILDDDTPYPLEGTMQFRDVTVDSSTGSVSIRVIVPNPDYTLLPGMYVRVAMQEGEKDKAILIPQQCVQRSPKGTPLVLLVDPKGLVEQRPVVIDRAIGSRWLIASGIKPGERVIVEGGLKAHDGDTVKTVPYSETPGAAAQTAGSAHPAARAK